MNYAIVKIGGKQYKVSSNDIIVVDKTAGEKGKKIKIEDVLLFVKDGKTIIGRPKINGVSVQAAILEQTRGKKQKIVKFRPKSRYRRISGARRFLTKLEIGSIEEKTAKASPVGMKTKKDK